MASGTRAEIIIPAARGEAAGARSAGERTDKLGSGGVIGL
jgi:hypothetical protein